jgi:hypothetical protein
MGLTWAEGFASNLTHTAIGRRLHPLTTWVKMTSLTVSEPRKGIFKTEVTGFVLFFNNN